MSETLTQLNIRLPDTIHRQLKAQCALDGFTIAEAVEQFVRLYLDNNVKLSQPKDRPK
jgi:hypothetical protein